jgi:acetyltransferase-like isoleucine patch superfamily enzyme
MKQDFSDQGVGSVIDVAENIKLSGWIKGAGNRIEIAGGSREHQVYVQINGDSNVIRIDANSALHGLRIEIGNAKHVSSRSSLIIGKNFSTASKGRMLLPNSGNTVQIGNDCMFSNNIVIRAGEYPHLIFDQISGEYLDVSDGIYIGNRVWVGEGAYINKAVTIGDGCIVGARSVLTKRFTVKNAVIAGNPARVAKENVEWVANVTKLVKGSPYEKSFQAARKARAT